MRKELGKEIRKLFRKMMDAQFPTFKPDKDQVVPTGWYVWTCQHQSGLWLHILLALHSTQDKFTIEGAWDFTGRLPDASVGANDFIEKPCAFRVGYLWKKTDYWWLLVVRPEEFERAIRYKEDPVERCLPLVAPAVVDAAEMLKTHLIPVFKKIVDRHGKLQ